MDTAYAPLHRPSQPTDKRSVVSGKWSAAARPTCAARLSRIASNIRVGSSSSGVLSRYRNLAIMPLRVDPLLPRLFGFSCYTPPSLRDRVSRQSVEGDSTMSVTRQDDGHAGQPPPRWQFSLSDLLVLTLVVSGLLAAKRTFQARMGPSELALIILVGISVVASGIPSRARWPWYVGLVFCLVAAWCLVPGPPEIRGVVAGLASGVYVLAGLPVVWPRSRTGARWPWMQGAFGCFVVAALITSVDASSMFLVAAPLCLCYLAMAISAQRRRSNLRVVGPALLVAGSLVAIGGGYFLTISLADVLFRIGMSVAVLGVLGAMNGWSGEIYPATEPSST